METLSKTQPVGEVSSTSKNLVPKKIVRIR